MSEDPWSGIASPAELAKDKSRQMRRTSRRAFVATFGGCSGLFAGAVGGTGWWLGVDVIVGSLRSMAAAALFGVLVGVVVLVCLAYYFARQFAEDASIRALVSAYRGEKTQNPRNNLPRATDVALLAGVCLLSSVLVFALGGLVAHVADPQRVSDPMTLWGPSITAILLGLVGSAVAWFASSGGSPEDGFAPQSSNE